MASSRRKRRNPFLTSIYRKDEKSLCVHLEKETGSNRKLMLAEAFNYVIGCGNTVHGSSSKDSETQLVTKEEQLKFTEMLLTAGANPNADGSALFRALDEGSKELVELLLKHACDVNVVDDDGRSALHVAVTRCVDIIDQLVSAGIDVNLVDCKGEIPLSAYYTQLNRKSEINPNTMELLLIDSDVNLPDLNGRTVLHHALTARFRTSVNLQSLLICDKIDVNVLDKDGYSPLMLLCMNLPTERDSRNPCIKCDFEIMKLLLQRNSNVNLLERNTGRTALHYCAVKPSTADFLRQLIYFGADINARDKSGKTPLYLSAQARQTDNVLCLLKLNAQVPKTYKLYNLEPLHVINQGLPIMAMLILCGHNWDFSTANYTKPRQFCFCGGAKPDYSILSGPIKENWENRVKFVEIYGSVKPLKHIARLAIRKIIGVDIAGKVEELNAPKILNEYILMNELEDLMNTFSN